MKKNWDSEIEQIWQKFQCGDNESFDLLYNKFIHILFTYGLNITSNRELVRDCIQDVFIYIHDSRAELHHVANISVYLRIALKNRLINALKKERRHLEYRQVSEFISIDEVTAEKQLENQEEEQQNRNRIDTILTLLTPKQRTIVRYRYIEGLSLEEISILLKINYQSVQNALQRAIIKIKKHFLPKS